MKIEKTSLYYKKSYPAVKVTTEENDNFTDYPVGTSFIFADESLWYALIKGDNTTYKYKDDRAEYVDEEVCGYLEDDTCQKYCDGKLSDDEILEKISKSIILNYV